MGGKKLRFVRLIGLWALVQLAKNEHPANNGCTSDNVLICWLLFILI